MAPEFASSATAKDLIDNRPSEKSNPRSGREILAISRKSNTDIDLWVDEAGIA